MGAVEQVLTRQDFDLPDWTPQTGDACEAETQLDELALVACTREPGHDGSHAAGDGDVLLAIWPADPTG